MPGGEIDTKNGKMLVLGDRVLVDGMRMAGIHEYVYADESTFEKDLLSAMSRPDISIIVTTNALLSTVSWRTKALVENTATPIVIGVTDITGKEDHGESLAWMIKRALGMDLMGSSNDEQAKRSGSGTG